MPATRPPARPGRVAVERCRREDGEPTTARQKEIERATDFGSDKSGRQNANDGDRCSIEPDLHADDAGVAVEPALPGYIAQDRGRPSGPAGKLVVGAVFAPMPRASETMATEVTTGVARSERTASRRS
jgi:hypothetical protein